MTVQHPLKCELLKLRSLIFTRNYVLFQIVFITRINWYFVSTSWIWQVWSKCPGVLYLAFSEISLLYNWIYKIKNQFTYFKQKNHQHMIKYTATFFRPEKLMFNMNVFLMVLSFFCVMISYKFCAHYKQTFSIISASLGFNTICVFLKPYYVCNFKWIVNVIRSRMYVPAYITYVYYVFIIHFNWQN